MKQLNIIALAMLLIMLCSCGDNSRKFEGIWIPVQGQQGVTYSEINIEKSGDFFRVTFEDGSPTRFHYDKEKDVIFYEESGAILEFSPNKKTNTLNLHVSAQGGWGNREEKTIELERMKEKK